MMDRKINYFLILSLCSAWIVSFSGCNGGMPFQPTNTPTPSGQEEVTPLVSATGIVVPEQWATLSMSNSGVIEQIYVSEGDRVEAGTILVRLNGREELEAAITAAQVELVSAQQSLDDLYENADNRKAAVQLALAEAQKEYDKAIDRRQSKEFQHGDPDDINVAYAIYIMAEQKVKDATKEYDEQASWRSEDDLIRANFLERLASARNERDEALRRYNYLKSLPDEFDLAISDGELNLAKTNLDAAQREWEKIGEDGIDPDKLDLAQVRLENAKANFEAAKAALRDVELSAPFAGTISRMDVHPNEWVATGQTVMLIADIDHLVVETTDLNEIDAARVNNGDRVMIAFDALPDMTVTGVVVSIAPKSEGAGVNYKVKIEIDNIPNGLRWGMTAFVDIEVDN